MEKYNVLVLGAGGFIGSVLCQDLLSQGNYRVYACDAFVYNNEKSILHLLGHKDFICRPTNVCDISSYRDFLTKADIIIPLAAIVGAPACDRNPSFADEVNFGSIRDLLKETSKQQRICWPNSNSGYGQTDGESQVTEESPLNPCSHYGKTKCAAERLILEHPLGVSLRLATVFGPSPRMRFDLLVNDFVQKLVHFGKLEIFEPHFKRNFVHIRDVSRVFIEMAKNHALTGVYNVGLDEANMSKWELAQNICYYLNMDPSGVTIGDGIDPDKRNYQVSNKKLLDTGFKFRYGLKEAVWDLATFCQLISPKAAARMGNA